jgi:nicotinamidase-related amidase
LSLPVRWYTEYCVDATCRRATDLGYNVTLVKDAHSTTDNSILTAEQIIAYNNHLLESVWSEIVDHSLT